MKYDTKVAFLIGSRVLRYHTSCTHFKMVLEESTSRTFFRYHFQEGTLGGYLSSYLCVPCEFPPGTGFTTPVATHENDITQLVDPVESWSISHYEVNELRF